MENFDLRKFLVENKLTSNSKILSENIFTDLAWAVKADIGNAVWGNSSPGRQLYNRWASGDMYKDPNSPFSKQVSWYQPDAVKQNAIEYDKADKAASDTLRVVSNLKKEICTQPKNPTKEDQVALSKSPKYLTAYIDYLQKESQGIVALHNLRLSMGMREKKNPYGLSVPIYDEKTGYYRGESLDKELLYKRYPKEWVDEMDLDRPIEVSNRIQEYQEKIKEAQQQLASLK